MAEMEVHEKVFPFVCDNPDCKKEYDLEDFAHVVALWGFIYLTKGEHSLIGLVCPGCNHTSLRKYFSYSIDAIQKTCIDYGLKYFVPFQPKNSEGLSSASSNETDKNCYQIPFGFEQKWTWQYNSWAYGRSFYEDVPYRIKEDDIPALLKIENNENLKIVPRIVPGKSIYLQSDAWLTELEASEEKVTKSLQEMNTADLVQTCLNYPEFRLIMTRNSLKQGYEYLKSIFNGFKE